MNNITKLQDNDGHWYWIPNELAQQFHKDIDNLPSEYMDAPDLFDKFMADYGNYMTDGSPDNMPEHFLIYNEQLGSSLVEKFASQAHESWKNWAGYMMQCGVNNEDGSLTIPKHILDKWQDQIKTKYEDLPATEKPSNRKEAAAFLGLLIDSSDSLDEENLSDGYHTFKELYEFRKLYNVALFNGWAGNYNYAKGIIDVDYDVHKSWKHSDGKYCFGGGWFIVMAELPTGQISNHYPAKDWDLFKIPEKGKANQFDGHTSQDVANRLRAYLKHYQ